MIKNPDHTLCSISGATYKRFMEIEERFKHILPIVEAAYWDEHTAGVLPGTGYNNRAQHEAGRIFGWRKSDLFKKWLNETKDILTPAPLPEDE